MIEVRIHGRRGQGVLVAAELLSIAALLQGRHAQTLPGFGSERADGEVVAFCRIDDREIHTQEPVTCPDALIIQDTTLLGQATVFDGLRDDGYLLVNSGRWLDGLGPSAPNLRPERAITVPATEIAGKLTGRSIPNAALVGGFAAMTGVVFLDSVLTAIRQRFGGSVGRMNAAAAMATFGIVRTEIEDLTPSVASSHTSGRPVPPTMGAWRTR
jgi:pyruvate ferredoxin oxidoreductase gamma subunit